MWRGSRPGERNIASIRTVVAVSRVARHQRLGGGGDAAQAVIVERQAAPRLAGAGLDLDEGEDAAAAGDEVDLADRRAGADGEDAPALEPQPPGGEPLRPPPAALGLLPRHLSFCARS